MEKQDEILDGEIVGEAKTPELKEDTLSYELTPKDNPKDRIQVEIGDSKDLTQFQPQVKVMRWDNEVNFSARLINNVAANEVVTQDAEKIIWEKGNISANFYDLPQDEKNPEGGMEFEVILKEKPATNEIVFTLNTKGLDFFYQPPLTQKEIDEGAVRPDNVVGSYAVYHKTKGGMNDSSGMEYKAGKAFHIFRPKVIDADGNEIWGELNINVEKGELTVTIDQKFLDKATYPVIVDPTFGYDSVGDTVYGGSTTTTAEGIILGSSFTASASGTLTNFNLYHGANINHDWECALYSYDAAETAGSLLDNTATTKTDATAGYNSTDVTNGYSIVSSTNYFLLFWHNSIAGFPTLAYDSGAQRSTGVASTDYWTWPATLTDTAGYQNDRIYSIYATYTASGTKTQINIGDTWKTVTAMQINIGDTWKAVTHAQINIGDTWKTIFTFLLSLIPFWRQHG